MIDCTRGLQILLLLCALNSRNAKLAQKVSFEVTTYFWNFGTLPISRRRIKLESSNSA